MAPVNAPDNPNGAVNYLDNDGLKHIPALGRGTNLVKKASTQKFTSIVSTTRVPTASSVSVTLRPVYSRNNLHDKFNLNDFAQGKLVGDKKKGYGGFL